MTSIVKDFSEISWLVDEPTYRADHALSYSTLKEFENSGFDGLPHLFDKKESSSLLLGSVVDTLLTGGDDEFYRNYSVVDIDVTQSGLAVINQLLQMSLDYSSFNEIPASIVSDAAKAVEFWKDDKWDKTRYDKVLKTGNVAECYDAMLHNEKKIVSTTLYNEALAMVNALRTANSTKMYFAQDDAESSIRRYYQLKFKFSHNSVDYRSMADLICVDYKNKVVYPVDLKTSSEFEWNFESAFMRWGYSTQARLYWRNIRDNMDRDEYFKDFKLADFRFIVVNKASLTPLVWEFPLSQAVGTLISNKGYENKDPYVLGEELSEYLRNTPTVPNGIKTIGVNTLQCLKKIDN